MSGQAPLQIAFFDVETTIPSKKGEGFELLEFAAVVLAAEGLHEVFSFSTLFRPSDFARITAKSVACNGITPEKCESAPRFEDVADEIYGILHGRIWAGHNIVSFDNRRIREAFERCNRPAPEPRGIIDTLPLLRSKFGTRAGNMKMSRLASYCGLGEQEHRSLEDVRMNIEVLKHCATMLFLEANFSDIFCPSTQASANGVQPSGDVSSSSAPKRPVPEAGRASRDQHPRPFPLGPQSGLATSLEGEISTVSAKSTAATSQPFDDCHSPLETRSAPADALIGSLAALNISGEKASLQIHPPSDSRSHHPVEGSRAENQADPAREYLSAMKATPQLSPDLRPTIAYAAEGPSLIKRPASLPGGWDLLQKEPTEKEAAPVDGERSPLPTARRASQRGGSFARCERPQEEERLRYVGEIESADKVVNWLNQVPGVEVWTEPEGNEPNPGCSPAAGRPGRRSFEAPQRRDASRVLESRAGLGDRDGIREGLLLREWNWSRTVRQSENRNEFGEGDRSHTVKRSVDGLDLNRGTGGMLSVEGESFDSDIGNSEGKGFHASRDEGAAQSPGSFHISDVEVPEAGCKSGYLEILRAAANQNLPEDEEVARRWSHGSGAENVNTSNSSGNTAARLSALAETTEVSKGSSPQDSWAVNGSGQGGNGTTPGSGSEEQVRAVPGYPNNASYEEREVPGGEVQLDEPPTPEVGRRKGLNCFPKFQKRVGWSKPERVSAIPSSKSSSSYEIDGTVSQTELAAFYLARESSLEPLSQSLEGFTEGSPEGNTDGLTDGITGRSTESYTNGLPDGLTDRLTEGLMDGSTNGLTAGLTGRLMGRLAEGLTEGLTGRADAGEGAFATGASPESSSSMDLELGRRAPSDASAFPVQTSYHVTNPVVDPVAFPFGSPSVRHVSAHIQLSHTGNLPHPSTSPPPGRCYFDPPGKCPSVSGNSSPSGRYFSMRSSPRRSVVSYQKGGLLGGEILHPLAGESPDETLRGPYPETTSSSDVASSYTARGGDESYRRRGGRKGSPTHTAYPPKELALESLQVIENPTQRGPPRLAVHLGGAPLHVLERQMRLRFSVGDSYAYDANGRPTFSVVGELSDDLVRFLEACDVMLMRQLAPHAPGVTWRQTVVQKEGEVDSIRIRIGAVGHQQTATYTTKFLRQRRSGKGIERLPLGVVDPLIFRSFFPHGCTIDVTFSIETYCVEGYAGCRLVASQLILV